MVNPLPPDSFTEGILAERERQERNKYPKQETVDKCVGLINQELLSLLEKRKPVRDKFSVKRCPECKSPEPYLKRDYGGRCIIHVPTDAYPDLYYYILRDVLRDKFVKVGWVPGPISFRGPYCETFEIIHPLYELSVWSKLKKWFRRSRD